MRVLRLVREPSLVAVISLITVTVPSLAAQSLLGIHSSNTPCVDIAMSPDAQVVGVRAGGEPAGIVFLNATNGYRLTSFNASSAPDPQHRRRTIAVGDRYGIAIGGSSLDSIQLFELFEVAPLRSAMFASNSVGLDVAIAPGERIAVARYGVGPEAIRVFDLARATQLASLQSNSVSPGARRHIALSERRALVLGGAAADSLQILDLERRPPIVLATHPSSTAPTDVAMTPDGRLGCVRAGGGMDAIRFFDMQTGAEVGSFPSPTPGTGFRQIALTDARGIVTGGGHSQAVQIFDLSGPRPVLLATHASYSECRDLAIDPSGRIACMRGTTDLAGIQFYDLQSGAQTASFATNSYTEGARLIAMTNIRAVVIGGTDMASTQFFSLTGASPRLLRADPSNSVGRDVVVNPGGDFAVVHRAGELVIHDLFTGNALVRRNTLDSDAHRVLATSDLNAFVLGPPGSTAVSAWGLRDGRPLSVSYYGAGCDQYSGLRARVRAEIVSGGDGVSIHLRNYDPLNSIYLPMAALVVGTGRVRLPLRGTLCEAYVDPRIDMVLYAAPGFDHVVGPTWPIPWTNDLRGLELTVTWAFTVTGYELLTSNGMSLRFSR